MVCSFLFFLWSKKSELLVIDPLAFKPNPQALMNQDASSSSEDGDSDEDSDSNINKKQHRNSSPEIYRPPKLVPMPYTDASASKSKRRTAVPTALTQITALAHNPHLESTTGTGTAPPTLQSTRARELARMTEFEEENFTRLVMKKSEAKRRRRDEADIALGGTGASGAHRARRAGAGLEDEFADV